MIEEISLISILKTPIEVRQISYLFFSLLYLKFKQQYICYYEKKVSAVMVNNIKQNEQSPLTENKKTTKRHMALEIQVFAWNRHTIMNICQ